MTDSRFATDLISRTEEIIAMVPTAREEELKHLFLQRFTDRTIDLEESWAVLLVYGLRVLQIVFRSIHDKRGASAGQQRPLGIVGKANLNALVSTLTGTTMGVGDGGDFSQSLYQRVLIFIDEHLRDLIKPTLRELDTYLLRQFVQIWEEHKAMTSGINVVFGHIDKGMVRNTHHENGRKLPTLTCHCIQRFYDLVFVDVSERLSDCVRAAIESERNGEEVDRSLLRDCVNIFIHMGTAKAPHTKLVFKVDDALSMPKKMDVYIDVLECVFLSDTRAHYSRKSTQWIGTQDVHAYLKLADDAVVAEDARISHYLDESTREKVIKIVLEEIVVKHQVRLIDEVKAILVSIYSSDYADVSTFSIPEEKKRTLKRMFDLFYRTHLLDPSESTFDLIKHMAQGFKEYVVEMGKGIHRNRVKEVAEINKQNAAAAATAAPGAGGKPIKTAAKTVKASASDPDLVRSFLVMHKNILEMTEAIFDRHPEFRAAMKSGMEEVLNKGEGFECVDLGNNTFGYSMADMLAAYCDRLLVGVDKDMTTDAEIESTLDRCMLLFNYLADKDMFLYTYRDKLARRLLNHKSKNDELERHVIGRLKSSMGQFYAKNLEGMITDFDLARESNREFGEHYAKAAQERGFGNFKFEVHVLTTGFWPEQDERLLECRLPTTLEESMGLFKSWYDSKSPNRALLWKLGRGEMEITANYPTVDSTKARSFIFVCTTLQGIVIRCFHEESGALSYEQVQSRTGINNDNVLNRLLHSLSCSKIKVLTKTGSANKIDKSDVFTADIKLESRSKKITLPSPPLEDVKSKEAVKTDRTFLIDACVVRIMKARKRLSHGELIAETLHQISNFKPDSRQVRQRIEHLIENLYMQRSETDRNVYDYLA